MSKHVARPTALAAIEVGKLAFTVDPAQLAVCRRVGLVTAYREASTRLGHRMTADDFSEFVDDYAVTLGEDRAKYAVTQASILLAKTPTTPTKETTVSKKSKAPKTAPTDLTEARIGRVEADVTSVRGEIAEVRADVSEIKATQAEILAILMGAKAQTATGESAPALTVVGKKAKADKPKAAKPAKAAKVEAEPKAEARVIALVDPKAKAKSTMTKAEATAWNSAAYKLLVAAAGQAKVGVLWTAVKADRLAGKSPEKAVARALANA